jgi:two-component system phosphate regulon sensor histidine kinase PhoR
MRRQRLYRRIFISHLILIAAGAIAVVSYAAGFTKHFYLSQISRELEEKAVLAGMFVAERMDHGKDPRMAESALSLGAAMAARITFVLPDGTVAGDSEADPATMVNHADRPEVRAAMEGGVGRDVRHSRTTGTDNMYVAVPVRRDGKVALVSRAAAHMRSMDESLASLRWQLALGGAVAVAAAAALAFLVSRRLALPMLEMRKGAERFASGDFSRMLPPSDIEEINALSDAFNRMVVQLKEKIEALVRGRNELNAVISSMAEGVIAVDSNNSVLGMNAAAARMLATDARSAEGMGLHEVVRNADLMRFVSAAISSEKMIEGETTLRGEREKIIRMEGSPLLDASGKKIGAVIVLNDITELRRLETVRRDFVANVSHELKTPITAIKAALETLREGALSDPEKASRFLEIASRHTDRLGAIVNDLLVLARLESGSKAEKPSMRECRVEDVLNSAVQNCARKAEEKGIAVSVECEAGLSACMEPRLIEQAVANLLDNAIKFSPPSSEIRLEAQKTGNEIVIRVRDKGCGIEARHLPRLFERFYRTDEARSRDLGGTGLGLSIVKHIAMAHNGRVSVESAPGKGSVFSIYIPSSA